MHVLFTSQCKDYTFFRCADGGGGSKCIVVKGASLAEALAKSLRTRKVDQSERNTKKNAPTTKERKRTECKPGSLLLNANASKPLSENGKIIYWVW